MKQFYHLILFIALSITPAFAQHEGRPRISPEEFRANMEATITEKVGLTPEEGQLLFPVFFEMKDKQFKLIKKMNRLKRHAENLSEEEYAERLKQIKRLQVNQAQLEEEYYLKMCQTIPASKVFRVMAEEDRFHREMLSRFNSNHNRRGIQQP